MSKGKLIGGTLLVIGTSVGAGILALPVATAQAGFVSSSFLLVLCWFAMTLSALLILEVNLWFPEDSNMISMAKATLGRGGEVLSWVVYLLLLYALLSAYIAGGGDVTNAVLESVEYPMPDALGAIIFTAALGFVVYLGTRSVDYVNRGLMSVKLLSFGLMLLVVIYHVKFSILFSHPRVQVFFPVMVMITSFGYASIIPSLRSYFKSDVKKLRSVVVLGSAIPLFLYLVWDFAILGTVPFGGRYGLMALLHSSQTVSGLMDALTHAMESSVVTGVSRVFTSISVLTSFLGVALCLSDFWADGLKRKKKGKYNVLIHGLTFLPPLILVMFFPQIFIYALQYAGIFCIILLGVLPIFMAWRGRYVKHYKGPFTVFGGKWVLLFAFLLTTTLGILGVVYS